MRSTYSTIPDITVTRSPDGHLITCSACDYMAVRLYRAAADVAALEHLGEHGRPR